MRLLPIALISIGCVPTGENELLGDSDRFNDTSVFSDSGEVAETGETGENEDDTELDDSPGVALSNINSEPSSSSTPTPTIELDLSLNNDVLSVTHGIQYYNETHDFANSMRISIDDTTIVVHYGVTQDPDEAFTTIYQLSYDIGISSLSNGNYTLETHVDVKSDTDGIVTQILDAQDFINE
jgi:hypothetical protein